jgi:hypothetical protein
VPFERLAIREYCVTSVFLTGEIGRCSKLTQYLQSNDAHNRNHEANAEHCRDKKLFASVDIKLVDDRKR